MNRCGSRKRRSVKRRSVKRRSVKKVSRRVRRKSRNNRKKRTRGGYSCDSGCGPEFYM